MTDESFLRIVGDDTSESEYTIDVATFRAEFFGAAQAASGDKKLTLLIDRLDRYAVDELADVGLTMEFVVRRRPSAIDSPDHPSRPRPRGKPASHADEPFEERPKNSSFRTGRRRSGELPRYPVPGVDE